MLRSSSLILSIAVLVACGGGGGGGASPTEPPPPTAPKTVTVTILDNEFSPRSVTVDPGDTVRWVLQGSDPSHTVTVTGGPFDSGFIFDAGGASFEVTFDDGDLGQTYEYHCVSHQACCAMQGSVRVGQNAPAPTPGYD